MYQFKLPDGALVSISGHNYRHLGNGWFANMVAGERPYIINCMKNHVEPPERPVFEKGVLLEPIHPLNTLTRKACQSIAFAATAEEQELRTAA